MVTACLPDDWFSEKSTATRVETQKEVKGIQTQLLRCIFGPHLFLPVTPNPTWQPPTLLSLAQAAYDERSLPAATLDPDRLAVLADALEDAGCTDAAILEHLRGPGLHVRGCWAVDLLLDKK